MAKPQNVAKPEARATSQETPRIRRMARLWLTGRWALLASVALLALAMAAITEVGAARIGDALAAWRGETAKPDADPAYAALELETRRLSRTVHAMAADRERLLDRIGDLEQRLGDITGSVARLAERPEPALTPALPPTPVAPSFVLLEPALGLSRAPITQQSSDETWAGVPLPRPAPRTEALHTGSLPKPEPAARVQPPQQAAQPSPQQQQQQRRVPFGVDLGGATSIEGVRALWMNVRTRSSALATLTPSVVQPPQRPGSGPQLRLVAGPLPSAAAAARLCEALSAGRTACAPVVFDGQPLALR